MYTTHERGNSRVMHINPHTDRYKSRERGLRKRAGAFRKSTIGISMYDCFLTSLSALSIYTSDNRNISRERVGVYGCSSSRVYRNSRRLQIVYLIESKSLERGAAGFLRVMIVELIVAGMIYLLRGCYWQGSAWFLLRYYRHIEKHGKVSKSDNG